MLSTHVAFTLLMIATVGPFVSKWNHLDPKNDNDDNNNEKNSNPASIGESFSTDSSQTSVSTAKKQYRTFKTTSELKKQLKWYCYDPDHDFGEYGSIHQWDVSILVDFSGLFSGQHDCNPPIGDWNVSSATNMNSMFYHAQAFQQDLSQWNVENVRSMELMFASASSFNQSIGRWDVSSVQEMSKMFAGAIQFNQDIGEWNVGNVNNMVRFVVKKKRNNRSMLPTYTLSHGLFCVPQKRMICLLLPLVSIKILAIGMSEMS